MAEKSHDIVILGSGSTAFAAALRAQSLGAKVLMIEKGTLGGTCINWGCIPSKTLIHASLFRREARLGRSVGLDLSCGDIDYDLLGRHKENVVRHLRQTRYLDILQKVPGLTLVKGTGRFVAPGTIEVGDRHIRSEKILIATGGFPRIIEIPGLQGADFLTSRSALQMKTIPRSLIVIGGGVIAMEMGQMYLRLGCGVTILEHGPRILPGLEEEPVEALREALVAEGMRIEVKASVCSVRKEGDRTIVDAEINGVREELAAERLLLAVGTAPATEGIGLEKAGVEVDARGFIKVDETMRTTSPGIWAAGDVTGGMMIATVGAREGIVAADNMINPGCGCRMDYTTVPMAIFTDPEVGFVGLTEAAALKGGNDVACNTIPASAIPKAHVTGEASGAIKMVAERKSGRILGVHLSCYRGSELINEAALALRCRMTVRELGSAMHVYPSMGEGLRICAQGFSRDISRLSCCAE
jgi:mercuric reductase